MRDAHVGDHNQSGYVQGALVSLIGLRDRLAVKGLKDQEALKQFREASCAELMKFENKLDAYSDNTLFIAEAANDNEWYDLCIRRSIIQILLDDYAGTPVAELISLEDVRDLDEELCRVGQKQGPIAKEKIPHGLIDHWWWHYPVEISQSILLDRRAFLTECDRLIERLEGLTSSGYVSESRRSIDADKANRMIRDYFDTVPILPLSRCPFCGQVNTFSIDTLGLDGLWWTFPGRRPGLENYELCPHFFNLMGAVKLHYPVHQSPLQVKPGPEVPFLMPAVMQHESVKAVVSQIRIGNNIAYSIFYYSEVPPTLTSEYSSGAEGYFCIVRFPDSTEQERLKMPPTWGTSDYVWLDENGSLNIAEAFLFDRDCDFELVPWIETGKLLWIQPEDAALTLHNTIDDCPYLDLQGVQHLQRIENGAVRYYQNHDAWYTENGEVWMTKEEYRQIRRARRAQQSRS